MSDTYTGRDEFNLQEAFEFAREAVRTLLAINGGGAVAVLAFYGQALAAVPGPGAALREALSGALGWFGWGTVAAASTTMAGYLTQYLWGRSYPSNALRMRWTKRAAVPQLLGLLMAVLSFAFFLTGISDMRSAIEARSERAVRSIPEPLQRAYAGPSRSNR